MKNKNKNKNVVNNSNVVTNGLASATGVEYNSFIGVNAGEILGNASPFLLSLRWVQLANTYKSNSFAKTAVDLPVEDAFRNGGFELDSQTLSSDELIELRDFMDDKGDLTTLKDVVRWGRLFGGGVLIANTEQDPDTPFNPETLKNKEVEFLACDRWQCYPQARSLYLADKFTLQDLSMGQKGEVATFDKSRVKVFTGQTQPYYIRNQLQGWGASIFEDIMPALSQYIKANNVILELLDEAKIDILKIFGLSDLLASPGGESNVKKRLKIFADEKNFTSVGVMDSQDDYDQKQLSFGGLDRLLDKIMLLICSSLRIPYSKVFGRGASGFSSGEDDLENYNGMVMATIREPITPLLKWMLDIRCCQLFGRKVNDLVINWKPLRILPENEQQAVKSQKISSYIQLAQLGIMTKKQVAEQLTTDKIILFKPEEIEAINDEMDMDDMENVEVNEDKTENITKNSKDEKKKGFLTSLVENATQWITVKPHGKSEPDYRHVPIGEDVDLNDKKEVKKAVKDFFNKEEKDTKIDKNKEYQEKIRKSNETLKTLKDKFQKLDREKTTKFNKYAKYKRELMWDRNGVYTNEEMQKLYDDYDKIRVERNQAVEEYNKFYRTKTEETKEMLENLVSSIDIEKKLKNYNADEIAKKIEEINKKYNYEELKEKAKTLNDEIDKRRTETYKKRESASTQEEKDKIQAEWSEWYQNGETNKQLREVLNKQVSFSDERNKAIAEAIRYNGGGEFKLKTTKGGVLENTVKNTNELLNQVVNKKYIPDFELNAKGKKGRACADDTTIYLESFDRDTVALHECMHWLESNNPEMLANSKAFLRYRTKNDDMKKLSELTGNKSYSKNEIAKADNFFSPYCGKEYETATEIMSMGVQRLFEHPETFIKEDREYFNFVIGNLRGEL